jgi:predicted choloylglycine hydrolase
MNIISKSLKGKEYMYKKDFMILCKNKNQAEQLSNFLNNNNENTQGIFKLKEGEIWHDYIIDKYDNEPKYKVKSIKNKIVITEIL